MNFPTVPESNEANRLWRTRYGVVCASRSEDVVARSLQCYGEWAEQELDLLSSLVREGDHTLEVGGELGAHALWLSQAVGDAGEVHVVEPRRLHLQQICANISLNGISNVHTHALWLDREARRVRLADVLPVQSGTADDSVRATRLDDLGLDSLSLIKVNFAGALVPLLQGGMETLRTQRPVVYVRLGEGLAAVAEVRALKEAGYRCWSHLPYLYSADNFNGDTSNQFPGQVHQNLIATPVESRLDFDRLREI
jgi:FkbM family methyltransferase